MPGDYVIRQPILGLRINCKLITGFRVLTCKHFLGRDNGIFVILSDSEGSLMGCTGFFSRKLPQNDVKGLPRCSS
jgi:hypothetical protein